MVTKCEKSYKKAVGALDRSDAIEALLWAGFGGQKCADRFVGRHLGDIIGVNPGIMEKLKKKAVLKKKIKGMKKAEIKAALEKAKKTVGKALKKAKKGYAAARGAMAENPCVGCPGDGWWENPADPERVAGGKKGWETRRKKIEAGKSTEIWITLRPGSRFKKGTYRRQDIGKPGWAYRVAGILRSGGWATHQFVITKKDPGGLRYRVVKGQIQPTKRAKKEWASITKRFKKGTLKRVKGDYWEAKEHKVREADKPTEAQLAALEKARSAWSAMSPAARAKAMPGGEKTNPEDRHQFWAVTLNLDAGEPVKTSAVTRLIERVSLPKDHREHRALGWDIEAMKIATRKEGVRGIKDPAMVFKKNPGYVISQNPGKPAPNPLHPVDYEVYAATPQFDIVGDTQSPTYPWPSYGPMDGVVSKKECPKCDQNLVRKTEKQLGQGKRRKQVTYYCYACDKYFQETSRR